MTREEILGAIARGWCNSVNSHKVMDEALALGIAVEIEKALAQPEQSEPWNAVQVATWIGNKLMHEPSMFERREVCRYVRSLGREPQLAKHFAPPLRELSDSDILDLISECKGIGGKRPTDSQMVDFAKAILAAARSKT